MSNLLDYATEELNRIGMIGEEVHPYNASVASAIMDLIKLFSEQGHSGFTAPYTIRTFARLANFKPLTPLTGEDFEWNEVEPGLYQNKRYSAVFKEEDGRAYNIEGKVFTDDGGETWFTNRKSKVYITFPYAVPEKPEEVYLNREKEEESEEWPYWNQSAETIC